MVRLSSSLWFTPTSYGGVFTKIIDHNLHRVYVDDEALSSVVEDGSSEALDALETRGVNPDFLRIHFDEVKKEIEECKRLVKENGWLLFSLYPLQFSVQTVNYCNARCDFCYANVPNERERKTMSFERIRSLKDYAALHGVKFGVSGGEPLLHPHVYDILSYRRDEVFDTLITNLTPDFDHKKLVETRVDLIQVSIHGYREKHDRVLKIKNAYSRVRERMINLLRDDVNVATNTVITPGNIDSMKRLVEDFVEIQRVTGKKLSYVRFVPVFPSGAGLGKYDANKGFMDEVKTLMRGLIKKFKGLEFEVPLLHSNPYEYFHRNNIWVCPAGSTVAVVRIDGRLTPCNQFLDTNVSSLTSLDEEDFHRIWLFDPLFSTMRRGIKGVSERFSCNECRYLIMKHDKRISKRM